MKHSKYNSSILTSIFKRKGGEGILTKLVDKENIDECISQEITFSNEEYPILRFKKNNLNWLLFTNEKIIYKKNETLLVILLSNLLEVNIAMKEEMKDGIVNIEEFTKLNLEDNEKYIFLIEIEKGLPYQGIYQMLHYISSTNKTK